MTIEFKNHIMQCRMLWSVPTAVDEGRNPWFKGSYQKTKRILKR